MAEALGDRWKTLSVQCKGGLNTSNDTLSLKPGEAAQLVNFEPSKYGGYRRINGFTKYEDDTVPGTGNILGVCTYDGATAGVVACRGDSVYFSSGSGWSAAINAPARTAAGKYRFAKYDYATTKKIAMCDGVNYAATWDGTTYTLLNAAGAPTNPKYVTFFLRRLVLAGYSADKQALILTAPDTDNDFQAANGAIELDVRDEIIGVRAFREQLFIFGRKTIAKLIGTSASDFRVVPVADNIGCIAADSIQEFDGQLVFLAPDGFRTVQATERIDDTEFSVISKPIFSIAPDILETSGAENNISSVIVRRKTQYRLFYPTTAQPVSDALGVLCAIRHGTSSTESHQAGPEPLEWSIIQGIKPACCDSGYLDDDEFVIHGGFADGSGDAFVYRQEVGFNFDGSNILSAYKTSPMWMEDPELRKLLQKVTTYLHCEGAATINCMAVFDLGDLTTATQPTNIMLFDGGSALFVYGGSSSLYGSATYGGTAQPRITRNAIGSGFLVQLEFTNISDDASFSIQAFSIQYRPLGRR
jgi:hypothetical protein